MINPPQPLLGSLHPPMQHGWPNPPQGWQVNVGPSQASAKELQSGIPIGQQGWFIPPHVGEAESSSTSTGPSVLRSGRKSCGSNTPSFMPCSAPAPSAPLPPAPSPRFTMVNGDDREPHPTAAKASTAKSRLTSRQPGAPRAGSPRSRLRSRPAKGRRPPSSRPDPYRREARAAPRVARRPSPRSALARRSPDHASARRGPHPGQSGYVSQAATWGRFLAYHLRCGARLRRNGSLSTLPISAVLRPRRGASGASRAATVEKTALRGRYHDLSDP
jgi:hypothetical protein